MYELEQAADQELYNLVLATSGGLLLCFVIMLLILWFRPETSHLEN